MTTRTPNLETSIPDINSLPPPIHWHSLKCELITPMYGGGVRSTVVDEKMPIRVTGIRGQLRFWWRLLAKQKWYPKLSNEDIRKKEFALWGGMADNKDTENDGKASLVMLRVRNVKTINIESWAKYERNKKNKEVLKPKEWAQVPYALFPAKGRTEQNPDEEPHSLLREGCHWTLEFAFAIQITEQQKNEVLKSIRWWASFGGVGSRTRRGLGAVRITESIDFPQLSQTVTTDEVSRAGCKLEQRDATNNPMNALSTAINKLKNFRQGLNVGRNEGINKKGEKTGKVARSRWPEPDAIRRIKKQHLILDEKNHEPIHPAGNIFPRAMFGLPIIFKFKNDKKDDNNRYIVPPNKPEPKAQTLVPKNSDRLASPLILRPVYDADTSGWKPSALLLPYKHILDMQVSIGTQENYSIWTDETANNIRPIQDNLPSNTRIVDVNTLTAFITYFSK